MYLQKTLNLRTLALTIAIAMSISCTKDPGEEAYVPDKPIEKEYTAPSYPDDYRPYAGWDMRAYWGPYNVHDPSMEKDGEYYYVFGTDASYGNTHTKGGGHYPYRRSKDLVNWEFKGFALSKTPEWVLKKLNELRTQEGRIAIPNVNLNYGYWAPCVRKVGDVFRIYYSIFIDDIPINYPNATRYSSGQWNCWTERSFIGMAEATSLNGPWTDKGMVLCSTADNEGTVARADGNWSTSYWAFNAIDPSVIVSPKDQSNWLVFGSWHTGIAAIELDPNTGLTKKDPTQFANYTRIARRGSTSRWQGSEAPEVVYNPKTEFFYLFLAYDELGFAYNTRVCRSININGPYYGSNVRNANGNDVFPVVTHPYKFTGHNGWQGISHNSVYYDDKLDKWFYDSQARPSGDVNLTACMVQHIREIIWTFGEEDTANDGWPIVLPERYAAVPQTTITSSNIVGTWEVILLKYEISKHRLPKNYVFAADGTFTVDETSGTWVYDQTTKVLTTTLGGAKERLYVQDAVDWEASPRRQTITFAGLTTQEAGSGVNQNKKINSIWGKKI